MGSEVKDIIPLRDKVHALERQLILEALKETDYIYQKAAYVLGMKRTTLVMKAQRLGVYKKQ